MPIFRHKDRWRYGFNRVIADKRYRFTKLLPAGWSRSRAEAWARQKEGDLYAQASGVESREPLIDEAVKAYLEGVVPNRKQGQRAASCLATMLPYYEGKPVSDLPAIATQYAKDHAQHAPATIYHRLAFLKAAARYAYRKGVLPKNYADRMEMPRVNNDRQTYITVKQLGGLLAHVEDEEAAALVKMAFYTGLRWISELYPLTPADVKRVGKELWLQVGMTKNGTPRMVPVHPAIRGCLKFLPFKRSAKALWKHFDRARIQAGLPKVRMHDLRHSLASAIVSAGGTLHDVGAALHHKSLASSRRYAHLYPERVRAVIFKVK